MTTAAAAHLSTLADFTRSRILLLLERGELAVGELSVILQLPQSTISRHLKVLGDDGWLVSRADGTSRFYRMAPVSGDGVAARLWGVVREDAMRSPVTGHDVARHGRVVADRRRQSKEYFTSVAGRWDEIRGELFGGQVNLRLAVALIDPGQVVADLGCGPGTFAELIAPHVSRVVAVDESPEMLAAARERLAPFPNVEVHQSVLEALPLASDSADTAVLSLVLHYITEPIRVLAETFRVLKPGARVIIVDMMAHDREELRHTMGHVWAGFPAEQLRVWLGEAGFGSLITRPIPADPRAKGPGLFLATGRKP